MKKTLLVVFSAALALVLLSSGLANTENKLNASSEDSEATQATNSLVVISSESDGSPNGNSAVLAVIDDVLVGTNPSPIVPMGAYKMDDPSSCGLEASEAANDGDIIDEIPACRMGRPEEVAELIFALATGHDYLTGQVITLDGGWI